MPGYIVTLKPEATDEEVTEAKQQATDQGGKITHEYTIIKGFAVSYDKDAITTLESNKHVQAVELDGEVTTQPQTSNRHIFGGIRRIFGRNN